MSRPRPRWSWPAASRSCPTKTCKPSSTRPAWPPKEADAIVTENANARIDGLRSSLALLAIIALIALFATRRIPAQQPTASPESEPTALTGEP